MDIYTFLLSLTVLRSFVKFMLYETWKLKLWPKLYSKDGLNDADARYNSNSFKVDSLKVNFFQETCKLLQINKTRTLNITHSQTGW